MTLTLMQSQEAIQSLLNLKDVTVMGIFAVVIVLLIYDRNKLQKDLKEKDDKIYQVIKEHQNDLKESSKDIQAMSDKWSTIFSQLKDIIKTTHGRV